MLTSCLCLHPLCSSGRLSALDIGAEYRNLHWSWLVMAVHVAAGEECRGICGLRSSGVSLKALNCLGVCMSGCLGC